MAESPPHVQVTTTGVKTDFADPPVRSEKPTMPPDTPQVTESPEETPRD